MEYDPAAQAEREYDRLDDQGQFDAATIREMSGLETDGKNEDFTAEAIIARAGGELVLRDVIANSESNPKYGLNAQAWARQGAAQKEINAAGLRSAREELHRRRNGGQ